MTSLQENLKARRARWFDGEDTLPIQGYGGELHARYKRGTWPELGPLIFAISSGEPSPKDVETAAKLFVAANVDIEAHVNGDVAKIKDSAGFPVKMGASLATFLGEEGAETDIQGVYLVFPSDMAIMEHASAFITLQKAHEDEADRALAGN